MKLKNQIFTYISLILIIFGFVSCSDTSPILNDVGVFIIFDYKDYESNPIQRLSAYVEVESEVKRVDKLTISYVPTGMEWTTNNPRVLSTIPKARGPVTYYAGYSNFSVPDGLSFPSGSYKFRYTDYNEKQTELGFYLSYPSYLLDSKAKDIPSIINVRSTEYYAVYDDDVLLYYGERLNEWDNPSKILNNYNSAKYYRLCYRFNGNVICMLPAIKLEK